MKNFVLASVAAMTIASPAFAAGTTGPRIEGRLGYDRVTLSGSVSDGIDSESASDSRSGLAYGGEAGFDFAVSDNINVGPYVGYDFSRTRDCDELYGLDRLCLRADRNLTAGIRASVPVAGNVLFYAKGGYSRGRLKVTYDDFENILEDVRESESRDGFHVGIGGELLLNANVYAKAELVHTNYQAARFAEEDFTLRLDGKRNQILAGIGARF